MATVDRATRSTSLVSSILALPRPFSITVPRTPARNRESLVSFFGDMFHSTTTRWGRVTSTIPTHLSLPLFPHDSTCTRTSSARMSRRNCKPSRARSPTGGSPRATRSGRCAGGSRTLDSRGRATRASRASTTVARASRARSRQVMMCGKYEDPLADAPMAVPTLRFKDR